jgi:hypothetical protein
MSRLDDNIEENLIESSNELSKFAKDVIKFAFKNHNPHNEGTKSYRNFNKLTDLEWHCSECELEGSQPASYIRNWRNRGFVFFKQEERNRYGKMKYCQNCTTETYHRKLKYPFPVNKKKIRTNLDEEFLDRVYSVYNGRDAIDDKKIPKKKAEVDHRKPFIRDDCNIDYENLTEEEIKEHFQILSRENNLSKSRKCEECLKEGKRPPSRDGIKFYYKGNDDYEREIGCEGCFYYNPDKWREELSKKINSIE